MPSEVYGEGSSPWASAQEAIDNISADHRDMIYSRFMSYGLTRPATLQPVSLDLTASVASARLLLNGQPIPTGELHGRVFAPAVLRAEAPAGYAFTGWRQALGTAKSIDLIAQGQWTAATTDSLASIETEATVTLEAEPSEGDEMLFTWQADDGFVLSVNGTEALRYHMPEGTITSSTQATTTCYYNPDRGIASLPIGLFRKGENTLTASVHDHYDGINAQDITWSAALTWHRNEANESIVSTSAEYALPEQGTYVLEACFEALDEANTPPVVVNEVSAGNTVSVNEYFKRDDWVELYNTTADTLDLAGLLLNDWPIEGPSTLIAPHGYKIIWCSKREAVSELHAPFKLTNADGQCIRLASPDGEWADSLVYCEHGGRQSVGRYPDATSNVYLMERTTIGASNALTTADAVVTLSGTNGVEAPKEQATPALPSRSYDLSGRPYSGRGLRIEKGRKVVR